MVFWGGGSRWLYQKAITEDHLQSTKPEGDHTITEGHNRRPQQKAMTEPPPQAHTQGENWGGSGPGPHPRGKLRGIRSRPTPKREMEGDQIQEHTQGGNWGGSDPGPPPNPREADCGIQSMSGRYASHWNAFLLSHKFSELNCKPLTKVATWKPSIKAQTEKRYQLLKIKHRSSQLIAHVGMPLTPRHQLISEVLVEGDKWPLLLLVFCHS